MGETQRASWVAFAAAGATAATAAAVVWVAHRHLARSGGSLQMRLLQTAGAETLASLDISQKFLQLHFASSGETSPFLHVQRLPVHEFAQRCGLMVERYCPALQDFEGANGDTLAVDIGCGVGGTTFELANSFSHVLGLERDQNLLDVAALLKEDGAVDYEMCEEGDITVPRTARVRDEIERTRARFQRCSLPELPPQLAKVDAVLVADVLSSIPQLPVLLKKLPGLLKPTGMLVLVLPYNWRALGVPKEDWLGGFFGEDGKPVSSKEGVKSIMKAAGMHQVHHEEFVYLVREDARHYNLGLADATVWTLSKS